MKPARLLKQMREKLSQPAQKPADAGLRAWSKAALRGRTSRLMQWLDASMVTLIVGRLKIDPKLGCAAAPFTKVRTASQVGERPELSVSFLIMVDQPAL